MNATRIAPMLLAVGLLVLVATTHAAEPKPAPSKTIHTDAPGGGDFLDYEDPKAAESPGLGAMLAKLVVPLFGVVGLIYLVAWVVKKKLGIKGMATGRGDLSEVVEVTPLGGQRFVYLVRVADRLMVLGVTQDSINALGEVSEDELIRSIQGGAARDFSQILRGVESPTPA